MKQRQIALRLAVLGDADRQWILDQLDATSRSLLEPLIAEVIAMNMHQDPSVLDALSESEHGGREVAVHHDSLAETVAMLPEYWRRVVSPEAESLAGVEANQFLSLLEHDQSGPQALRRALVEISQLKKQVVGHV